MKKEDAQANAAKSDGLRFTLCDKPFKTEDITDLFRKTNPQSLCAGFELSAF